MSAVVIVVLFLVVIGAVRGVVIVPVGSAYIIERLGRYRGTLPPGFNLIIPMVDRVAFKHLLTTQSEELSDVYETKDRRRASVKSECRFRILDAQRASYGAADYLDFLRALVRTSQRRYIEGKTWDALREDTRSLEGEVMSNVDAPAEAVGVKVLEYHVRDLQVSGS